MQKREPNGRQAEASHDDSRLHPELEAEVLRRSKDGQKAIPAEQVWKDLGL